MMRQQEDKNMLQQHLGNEYSNQINNRHQTEQMNVFSHLNEQKPKYHIERKNIGPRKKND